MIKYFIIKVQKIVIKNHPSSYKSKKQYSLKAGNKEKLIYLIISKNCLKSLGIFFIFKNANTCQIVKKKISG